ncbi:MAG: hypothetical protein JKY03_08675 [Aureispira sp.]|nr:hypothetical protein [Aureispira sp.]
MIISKLIKVFLLFTAVYMVNLPCGYSEVVYDSPPVEKTKPNKKKKRSVKGKYKFFLKNLKEYPPEGAALVRHNIFYYFLLVAGITLFILGAFIGLWWILGLCLLVASYVYAFLILHIYDGLFLAFWVFVGLVLGNFVLGLTFLIYGLIVSIPLFWIVGIILLCLFLVFWILAALMTKI